MKTRRFVRRLSKFATMTIAIVSIAALCCSGCSRRESTKQRGASQVATVQDKQDQNKNLIRQVVDIVERQESYPDSTYLKGSISRLNPWLAERPDSVDYEADAEFAELKTRFDALATDARRAKQLIALYLDEAQTPSESDGDELQTLVDSLLKETNELGDALTSNALKSYSLYFQDLKTELKSAREFQFADPTETFRTKLREFSKRPAAEYFNCAALLEGVDEFRSLLVTDSKTFLPSDADFLCEAVWARDAFSWAKGTSQNDLDIVKSLFDWSVRNVTLAPPMPSPSGFIAQTPRQTLLLSQGTPMDRALVFMELLRQHRLDSFILRPNGDPKPDFPLVVGVRLEGETLLFLPEYGLPIPAENSVTLERGTGLTITSVATLSQVAANDALLRRFDLPDRPLNATSDDFKETIAYVPSTPFTVSSRMIYLEQEFSAQKSTVLCTPFESQRARVAELQGVVDVRRLSEATAPILEQLVFPQEANDLASVYLTTFAAPKDSLDVSDSNSGMDREINDYTKSDKTSSDAIPEALANSSSDSRNEHKSENSPLWVGKTLYLRGQLIDENGASVHFLQARIPDRVLKREEASISQRTIKFLNEYKEYMASQNQPVGDEQLQSVASETVGALQAELDVKRYVKILATFYLAQLSDAVGNDDAALERLNDECLRVRSGVVDRSYADEWRYAANYLRARILEKRDAAQAAIARYRTDDRNIAGLTRAKWLEELMGIESAETPSSGTSSNEPSNASEPQTEPSDAADSSASEPEPSAPTESAPESKSDSSDPGTPEQRDEALQN